MTQKWVQFDRDRSKYEFYHVDVALKTSWSQKSGRITWQHCHIAPNTKNMIQKTRSHSTALPYCAHHPKHDPKMSSIRPWSIEIWILSRRCCLKNKLEPKNPVESFDSIATSSPQRKSQPKNDSILNIVDWNMNSIMEILPLNQVGIQRVFFFV